MARLVFQLSADETLDLDLTSDPVTIGRAGDNVVVIDNLWISTHHASIQPAAQPGRFEIVDLASHNGTFLNGARVGSALLSHGDRIKLGQLEAVFEDGQGTAARIQPMRPAAQPRGGPPAAPSRAPIPPRPAPIPRPPATTPPSPPPLQSSPENAMQAASEAQRTAADAQARTERDAAAAENAEKRKAESQTELNALDQKISEARATHEREIIALGHAMQKQAALSEEAARTEAALTGLKHAETISERAVGELQEQRTTLEADVEAFAEKLREKARLVDGITLLQTQCDSLRREIDAAEPRRAEVASVSQKISSLQETRENLKREIGQLEEVRRTMQEAPDPSWGTVHVLAKAIIKRVDWVDDMIAVSRTRDPQTAQQLRQLRESLLELLHENSVTDYTFPVGTKLDIATRKRIQIMESTNGAGEVTEIIEVYRPGYLCTNGTAGGETLLRKAEVKTGRR
ncbi:MAG: nucleotide exchange factor GrpE [Verrucomicrobiales bacterium]